MNERCCSVDMRGVREAAVEFAHAGFGLWDALYIQARRRGPRAAAELMKRSLCVADLLIHVPGEAARILLSPHSDGRPEASARPRTADVGAGRTAEGGNDGR